jgi:hypothetical protein
MTTRHRPGARLLLVGLAIAMALACPALAAASTGVRINIGRIDVNDHLVAGRTYHLPDLEVSNPGTEAAGYVMAASTVTGQTDGALDPAWVSFDPPTFSLDPGQSQRVAVAIAPSGSGVSVGAAAAARITFTTSPPDSAIDALMIGIGGFLAATQPWPFVVLLVLASLVIGRIVMRRWDIRIQRR